MDMRAITIRDLAAELAPVQIPQTQALATPWRRGIPRGRPKGGQWITGLYKHKTTVADIVPKLWDMVEYGYVQMIDPSPDPNDVGRAVVIRPPDTVMEWMRVMFMPPHQRPLITFEELGIMLGSSPTELVIEAQRAGVEVTEVGVLGRLVSMEGLITLAEIRYRGKFGERGGQRGQAFSRIEILAWLCGLEKQVRPLPAPYGIEMEKEIARIARLKSPARTIAAVDLLARYADVATIAEGIHGMSGVGEVVERQMGTLARYAFGWDKGPEILEKLRLDNEGVEGDTGA